MPVTVKPDSEAVTGKTPKRAALAGFLGSAVEYYDFFIYGAASALVLDKLFFPNVDPAVGTLAAMATFGAGYVVRPLGAVVFGHFGDRLSRKKMLVLTLLLMGISTFLIGCLPTYGAVGIAAPILLVVLRLIQGASAAGEWGGAIALSVEHAPQHRRALVASWTPSGALAGSTIASVVFIGFSSLPEDQFMAWGWRVPFLLSVVLVGIGLVVRAKLPEPPGFERLKDAKAHEKPPVVTLMTKHGLSVARVVGCSLYSVIATIGGVYALAYATSTTDISATTMLTVKLVSTGAAVAVQPLAALAADRVGRKPIFMAGGLICAASAFLLFWAIGMENLPLIFVGHFLLVAVGYSLANGVAPALYSEMFDASVRYTGVALSSQLGQVLTGFAPTIASALVVAADGGWIWVAVATAGACLTSVLVTLTVRETYKSDVDGLHTA
ncbi:MFS transporter [Streptomyces sp. OE57]|uniref:MFS transporter n=1 Tax=Streptomyces lacaronensis TaxID=3379885 RepID=UPI0039B756BF